MGQLGYGAMVTWHDVAAAGDAVLCRRGQPLDYNDELAQVRGVDAAAGRYGVGNSNRLPASLSRRSDETAQRDREVGPTELVRRQSGGGTLSDVSPRACFREA